MFRRKIKFKNSKGLTLTAIYEGESENASVVVMCHGFGSSKDGSAKDLSQKLVSDGISVFRFDFTGCGQSEGEPEDRTPLQGVDDLESAVRNLKRDKFALYGTSYGGWVSLVYASNNPVTALGLKCPVSSWSQKDLPRTKDTEYIEKGIPGLPEAENYNIYEMAAKINAPTLIVHGSDDEVVPLAQSQKLLENLGGEKELAIIHGGVHTMRGPTMEDAHVQLAEFFRNKLL